jgi:hypothetical protein
MLEEGMGGRRCRLPCMILCMPVNMFGVCIPSSQMGLCIPRKCVELGFPAYLEIRSTPDGPSHLENSNAVGMRRGFEINEDLSHFF